MTASLRFPLRIALLALAAALAFAAAPASHAAPAPYDGAGDIVVPEGNKLFLVGHAVGVQIYTCNGSSWGPATPRADLFDDRDRLIATHFAGPTWQARDGSSVVAKRDVGITVDADAIPWLRLSTVSTSVGEDGDRLAHTTYIQRINTTGGLSPDSGNCDAAGARVEVPYTADYLFYKKQA